ncbi:MAG: hypothetical protein KAG84_03220 [Bacteroidales bacterium]|nr:hypothetical protein [Bacteroidales bacterium]
MAKSSPIKEKASSAPKKAQVDIALEEEFLRIEGFEKALQNLRQRLIKQNIFPKETLKQTNK